MKEAIVVEGRYDKSKLSSLVDGVILETNGFGIFRDREKLELIRRLARERGLVVLTDSDGAGFLIRGKLASCIPPERIKNAYIPDVPGKERRKEKPSKEGKLGVEGMSLAVLRMALERAGATVEELPEKGPAPCAAGACGPAAPEGTWRTPEGRNGTAAQRISKADLYELGLSGGADSAARRRALQRALDLPERLSANGLLQALNALYGRTEFLELAASLLDGKEA